MTGRRGENRREERREEGGREKEEEREGRVGREEEHAEEGRKQGEEEEQKIQEWKVGAHGWWIEDQCILDNSNLACK